MPPDVGAGGRWAGVQLEQPLADPGGLTVRSDGDHRLDLLVQGHPRTEPARLAVALLDRSADAFPTHIGSDVSRSPEQAAAVEAVRSIWDHERWVSSQRRRT